jgi:predicted ATP-grasp superfamily ATP-dependent carboligase
MTVRRRRQHPIQFGRASTYVETVDLPILEEFSEKFLRKIGYYGLVEVEYKLDPRDSQYKLLDVNARTWGYHTLGANAGLDFSYMLFSDQLGWPVSTCQVGAGLAWMRMMTDLPAACMALRAGDVDLKSYMRTLRTYTTEAVFSVKDPLPGFAEMLLLPYLACKRGL